ncbi:MAG: sugar-binding domain-containing protein [Candidatus Limnocylindrales bacterium]
MTRASDLETLVRISRLYYELGETQEAIAATMGITRPQVSKLLKRARAQGVVEIRIVDRSTRPSEVAVALQERFGLRAVHVAPSFAGSDELTRRRVGRLAAQVLVTAVRDGMIVGIGDGSALAAMADGIDDVASPVSATVVPLCGGFWGTGGGHEPYRRIAESLGANAIGLLAPGLLDDALTRNALAAHAGIREVTSFWDRLDVAILGIGGPAWSEALVGTDILRELEASGAVGEMLIAPFDIEGRFVAEGLRDRTIACDARRLSAVPISIGVASGSSKVEPILGALRTGALGVLVTDLDTAERVLELAAAQPAVGAVSGTGR